MKYKIQIYVSQMEDDSVNDQTTFSYKAEFKSGFTNEAEVFRNLLGDYCVQLIHGTIDGRIV